MSGENGKYEFVSNGGCSRCDARDGRLSEGPTPRPHPGCNCQIIWRDFGANNPGQPCDESKMRYEYQDVSASHHSGPYGPDDEFDLVFTFRIHCPDGEMIDTEVLVTATYGDLADDQDALFEDAMAEALGLVEEIAASECQACPEPPLVA